MGAVFRLNAEKMNKFTELLPTEYAYSENMFAYGMIKDDVPCAVALLETEYNDVFINYFYVRSDDSSDTYYFINSIAYEMSGLGMERLVYNYLEDEFEQRRMANLGFLSIPGDGAVFEFSIKDLLLIKLLNTPSNNTIALKNIGGIELKALCSEISEKCMDIVEMPIRKEDYIADCSVVYMENNVPNGIMLLEKVNDTLLIPYIYSTSSNPMAIVDMMRFMFTNAKAKFDENTICRAYVIDLLLVKIIEKITGIKGKYQQTAVRYLSEMAVLENKVISEFPEYESIY